MKLELPFVQLPVRFDTARLKAEVAQFEQKDWRSHPSKYDGNSALRLITREGGDNDDFAGHMKATEHLARCPYIRQIIRSFGVVVSRSRLMRLAPNSVVPEHSDVHYHWYNRVRIHIPVITNDQVFFHCDGQVVNMKEGEAWIFDNWRSHMVENRSDITRIHLVIDTVGSSPFWNMCRYAQRLKAADLSRQIQFLPYRYTEDAVVATETDCQAPVIDPYALKYLCADFYTDISFPTPHPEADACMAHFRNLLTTLYEDWSALYALYGADLTQRKAYQGLLDRTQQGMESIPLQLLMKSNGMSAKYVFLTRVMQGALAAEKAAVAPSKSAASLSSREHFDRPLFIVAAPRSGSTLLFETLAKHPELSSLGDESHEIFEGVAGFNPATGAVASNQLTEQHYNDAVAEKIAAAFWRGLKDSHGQHRVVSPGQQARLLEKTPKNALRIRFLRKLFPDARFVFLHRSPQANIGSMIDAWQSGKWVTYPTLPGRSKPWSLLLPPGWQQLNDAPLAAVAAHQWRAANEAIMADLADLPAEQVLSISYETFLEQPQAAVTEILRFAGLTADEAFLESLSKPLPLSKYTLSAPDQTKWHKHAEALQSVESVFTPTRDRIAAWLAR